MDKKLITNKPSFQEFTDILEQASLTTYHDPNLSSATKLNLYKELQSIGTISVRYGDWNDNKTHQLVTHLRSIKELAPEILIFILQ